LGFNGNPQIAVATLDGARNTIPAFITQNGPVREARFVLNPDDTLDGGVHDLFVITGRSDAQGCNTRQPDFATQLANSNVIFRIPTPVFGLGLVENVPDGDQDPTIGLQGAFNSQSSLKATLARNLRTFQSQRQRRHHYPVWMEGAKQVSADLRRRGLQRGTGRDQ
jgi:hypothetical protein